MIFIKTLYEKKFYTKKILIKKKFLIKKKLFHLGLIDGNFQDWHTKKRIWKISKGKLSRNIECGHCQKTACQYWHRKLLVSCKYCRETFCKACLNFNIVKETLLKGLDPIGKEYTENFMKDFLCISSETLQANYNVSEKVRVPIEKTFNVKSYHKSNKNRSQGVYKKFDNCEKLSYTVKEKSRKFYKKF